jgi:hypothetical protein
MQVAQPNSHPGHQSRVKVAANLSRYVPSGRRVNACSPISSARPRQVPTLDLHFLGPLVEPHVRHPPKTQPSSSFPPIRGGSRWCDRCLPEEVEVMCCYDWSEPAGIVYIREPNRRRAPEVLMRYSSAGRERGRDCVWAMWGRRRDCDICGVEQGAEGGGTKMQYE